MNSSFWLGFEKQASSMSEIAGGLGHAANAFKGRVAQGLGKAKSVASDTFERVMAQPGTRKPPMGAAAPKGKPQPSFLTKARIYGKGAVAGGAVTAAGFGIHSMARSANQGAMQPMQQGYY